MTWFVAKRALVCEGKVSDEYEFRVVSEEEIDCIGPEWDWASGACDSREEALQAADDCFWDSFD